MQDENGAGSPQNDSPPEMATKGQEGFRRDTKNNPVSIVHQGVEYPLVGMDDADFEEVENFLMKNRKNPLLAIKGKLEELKDDPELQAMMVDRAYRDLRKHDTVDVVTRQEVSDYLDTREGAVRSVWLMLRKVDPAMTIDRTKEILQNVSTAEALKKRDQASRPYIEAAKGG